MLRGREPAAFSFFRMYEPCEGGTPLSDTPLVSFDHFSFQYHAQSAPTLHDICLTIRKGEKVVIAGPSGCGKSTLAHCINGLIPSSYPGEMQGEVRICGKSTRELSLFDISRTVGTVLQDSDGQFIGLTVAEDIAFALENDCVPTPEMHERVERVARTVGIASHLTHAPHELSGGQKQRTALAGVMIEDVDLLLFDEPLANLDPATGKSAMELIDAIQRETGAAVVIIEHRLEDVLHCPFDRIVLMEGGRILADTSPDTLLCGDLLMRCGVREPLYLSALRYAGISVTPDMHPASLQSLSLTGEHARKIRDSFAALPPPAQEEESEPLLTVSHLTFAYPGTGSTRTSGRPVLRDLSVTLHRGEMTAIVGTNGAGKSTFSKVLCGFEKQQSGSMSFPGVDSWDSLSLRERADHVGYVMQNPNQMISCTMIYDEIALGLRNRHFSEELVKERVEEALHTCGLWPFRNWPVSALSFGQKKRVTIASILALHPEIIILDEPTAGQDYRHYTAIMEFLRSLNAQGVTVLMITHDMHLMLEYARRALVFSDGEIIADASPAAVLTHPEIASRASLRETSLYTLSHLCAIPDAEDMTRRFIAHERKVARHE